ncbi:MAG: DegV family protein [Acetatifactor sp.]|nr:DegV family protein [Acetatifactor sp.]
MTDYVILTESTCDLTQEMADNFNLEVVRLHVILDGKEYENYLDGRELSFKDMYDSMRNKKLPTTSQVNTQAFTEAMEPILASGKDILYVAFSSPMSGTQNSGRLAAEDLLEKYPDRKIEIVDTLAASLGEGFAVYMAAKKKEEGLSLEDNAAYVRNLVPHLAHTFTVTDLMHIMRGGRATKSSAVIGSMLGIKPMMHVNDEGLMEPLGKVRGRKASIRRVVEIVKENMVSTELPYFVGHGDCEDEAMELAEILKSELGLKNVFVNYLGAICGCHAGPGIIGVFYYGKKR